MQVGGSSPSLFIRVYSVVVSTGGFQSLSVSSNLARLNAHEMVSSLSAKRSQCGFDSLHELDALWCNGSTWDFDSRSRGSSPCEAIGQIAVRKSVKTSAIDVGM